MYWDKIEHDKFEVSIKALIYDDQQRLLLEKDVKGKWDLPGGRISAQETIEQCLRREVQEELGVSISRIEASPKYAELISFIDNKKRFSIGFKIVPSSFNFVTDNVENTETGFFTAEEFDNLDQAYQGLKLIKNKLF